MKEEETKKKSIFEDDGLGKRKLTLKELDSENVDLDSYAKHLSDSESETDKKSEPQPEVKLLLQEIFFRCSF